MSESESQIEAACCAVAAEFDGLLWKIRVMGRRGGNDRLLILPFVPTVYVELKDADGKQSELQKQMERALMSRGHAYWLVRSAASFRDRIRSYVAYWEGRLKAPHWG